MDYRDILQSIESFGTPESVRTIEINQALGLVLDYSSGKIRLRSAAAKKLSLEISSPLPSTISPLSVRCLYCNRVISYPVWHMSIARTGKEFHYFLCFNGSAKPELNCVKG